MGHRHGADGQSDPTSIANGVVTLWPAVLMAVLRFGPEGGPDPADQ